MVCIIDTSLRNYMQKNSMRKINKITCVSETCISAVLLQYDLNKRNLTQYILLKSCRSTQNQPVFYKDIIKIIMNTIIKYFQTIHRFLSEPMMIRHHIVLRIQQQDQKFQNGTAYLNVLLNVL